METNEISDVVIDDASTGEIIVPDEVVQPEDPQSPMIDNVDVQNVVTDVNSSDVSSSQNENVLSSETSDNEQQIVENAENDINTVSDQSQSDSENVQNAQNEIQEIEDFETDKIVDALKQIVGITSSDDNLDESVNEDVVSDDQEISSSDESETNVDYSSQIDNVSRKIDLLSSKLDNFYDTYSEINGVNSFDTPLNDLSLTNILLILIFVLFLAEFAIKFIRGLI